MLEKKLIILHESDNVGIAIANLSAGLVLDVAGKSVSVAIDIAFGHKMALVDIPEGMIIKKYGVAIGVATEQVKKGEHVHVHNMESLYMKQYSK